MSNFYEMNIAGLKRQLPLCSVNEHLDIAAFIIFGDVEMNGTEEYSEKIGDFYTSLTTDKRFILLDTAEWDLKDKHKVEIILDEDDEEEFEPKKISVVTNKKKTKKIVKKDKPEQPKKKKKKKE